MQLSFHLQNIIKIQAKNAEQELEFLRQLCRSTYSYKKEIS